MTRLLGLAAAVAAAAALTAPASAAVYGPTFCGGTFQPECDVCLDDAGVDFCVPVTFGPGS